MAFDPRNNRADQPARLAHLDNGNQRAILVEGGEGPAQIIGLRHWRAPSLSFPATMVPPPRRPAHSIYYFGSIPHADLLKSVSRRLVDRRVLHLIKMWLDCPVEETDERGRKTRTTEARDNRRGIPQGSPLSPLLANLYMRRFVLGWKKLGLERSLG